MAKKTAVREQPAKAPKKENYFKRIFGIYLNSFREISTDYFYYVFYDLLFLVVAGLLIFLLGYMVKNLSGLDALAAMMQNVDQAGQLQFLEQAKSALILTVVMFFVLVVLLIICWSFAKTFIYNKIYSRKFEWKVCLKFVAANLATILIFLALLTLLPNVVVQDRLPVIAIIVLALMLYFITIFYITFFREGRFAAALTETMNTAVVKLPKLVIPFLALLITLLLAIGIFSFITKPLAGVTVVSSLLTLVFLLFAWAWARLYLVKMVNYAAGKE